MGYGFRWKWSFDHDAYPIEPLNYDPEEFELFRRGFNDGIDIADGKLIRLLVGLTIENNFVHYI